VRHRSVKRVASAVGESAIAIQLTNEYLTEQLLDIGDNGIHRPGRASTPMLNGYVRRMPSDLH
jgi:hypothetical protein